MRLVPFAVLAFAAATAACQPAAPPAAQAPVSSERGRTIARDWCASCHVVEEEQEGVERPNLRAPSFFGIARNPRSTQAYLRQFMDELHLPMPTFRLWPPERDDVVAYILTLRPPGG